MQLRSAQSKGQGGTFRQRCLLPAMVLLAVAVGLLALVTVEVCLAKKLGPVCLSSPAGEGQWSTWGACDVACGDGNRTRVRVRPADADSSRPEMTVEEVGSCFVPGKCDEVFRWQSWTEWDACTKTCGPGGSQHRSRQCRAYNNVPADVSKCPGGDGLRRDCSVQPPPCTVSAQDVHWSLWSTWNSCTAACGPNGTQDRTRLCWTDAQEPVDIGSCPGSSREARSCNSEFTCVASYHHWAQWSPWNVCSRTCGEGGTQARTRQCQTSSMESADASKCSGNSIEQQACTSEHMCPSVWADWSSWGRCSNWKCHRVRFRSCVQGNFLAPIDECRGGRSAMEERERCFDIPGCASS